VTGALAKGYIYGLERVTAWAGVLDDINVFPVADGDTGSNLVTSLAPLRLVADRRRQVSRELLLAARGNSGNIAASFVSALLEAAAPSELPLVVKEGRRRAWRAVVSPVQGTMLSVFDTLSECCGEEPVFEDPQGGRCAIDRMATTVADSPRELPELDAAGVVDAGALGMLLFLEGFIRTVSGGNGGYLPVDQLFAGRLRLPDSVAAAAASEHYCVDAAVSADGSTTEVAASLAGLGKEVVVIPHNGGFKVHLHTADLEKTRRRLEAAGDVVHWQQDNLDQQVNDFRDRVRDSAVHIVTDAAGSIPRRVARSLGITLLDSYVNTAGLSLPETLFDPAEVYRCLRQGEKVTTSQASAFERQQLYERITRLHDHVLYLCVGSIYTGNYREACRWCGENDPENRLTVIDSGAASGRLAVAVMATAEAARRAGAPEDVTAFARRAVAAAGEYVFLDRLKYLAAGGRLSRSSAVMGDLLRVKPVITPTPEGATKVGAVRSRRGQLRFALDRLAADLATASGATLLLQYSDNREWVEREAAAALTSAFPIARIRTSPLSLTSGVHMGPGTWAVAFLADSDPVEDADHVSP